MNISKDKRVLPESWASALVDDLCIKIHYGYTATTTDVDTGVKYLRITDITENGVEWRNVPFCKIEKDEIDKFVLEENDLVFARTGGTVGKSYLIRSDVPVNTVFASYLIRLKASKNVNPKLLAYYFQSSNYWQFIELNKTGLKTNVNAQILSNIPINVPPFNEQNRIVEKLDELLSELEKGKEQLQTSLEQLKVYRQSILKWAFEGKLTNENINGELPTGWKLVELNDIADKITDGEHFRPKTQESGIAFLSAKDVRDEGVFFDEPLFISEETAIKALQRCNPQKGDILIVSRGATVGRMCIVNTERKFCLLGSVILIKIKKEISSIFINYVLKSPVINQKMISISGATAQQAIYLRDIKNILLPLPSHQEQEQIVSELESKLSVCDKMEKSVKQVLQQTEVLKQSILQKAFEGKLVEQHPNDESASILLERIKKEREEYLMNGKSKKKATNKPLIEFPKVIPNIAAADLHTGIISMIIAAHVSNTKYNDKLNHVKCEKIADLIERKLGISLGRKAMKDAAGPDDYPHLKKVEHRAKMIGAFSILPLEVGHTYMAMKNMPKCIEKAKAALTKVDLEKITELINTFLPFDLEHAELVATIYAGWNNLLIKQQIPSDEEIVYESRENWSKRKLTIPRENFFKTLNWMRTHDFVPQGKGQLVLNNNKAKANG